jgi:hypothetical protein
LIEEQVRIAYVTGAGISVSETESMTTEDRKLVVEVLKQIKEEEKEEMKKNQSKGPSNPPPQIPPNLKASSKSSFPPKIPNIPRGNFRR